ncbi:MAG: TRAP transporter substrate-binding protein [Rubrobacteraceae bacterium]
MAKEGSEKAAQAEYTMVLSLDGIRNRWPDQPVYEPTMYIFGAWQLKQAIEKRSKDRIFVEVHPAGELGAQTDAILKVQAGIVDCATASTQNTAAAAPVWNVTDIPYSIGPVSNYWKIVYSKEVNDTLRKTSRELFKLMPLAIFPQLRWLEMGPGITEKITKPEDIDGLKIRVTGSQLEQESFAILPASPTPVAWTEVFTALDEGAVDGIHVGTASVADAGLVEVLGQVIDTTWMYNADTFFLGTHFFDSLPEDLQEAVMEAAFDTQVWVHNTYEELFTKQVGIRRDSPSDSIYKEAGVEFTYLTEQQRGAWEEMLGYENNKEIYDPIIERYGREEYETVVDVANSAGAAEQKRWWK